MEPRGLPGISIALATYDGQRYLGEQLASLAAQTLPPAEIVACDDGSRDDTLAILEAFRRRSGIPTRIYRNPRNLGYRVNFVQAALLCRGEAVAFCDQDDVWDHTKLAVCAAELRDPRVQFIQHVSAVVDGELRPLGRTNPGFTTRRLRPRLEHDFWSPRPGHAMVFRRTLFDGIVPGEVPRDILDPALPMPHDHLAWLLGNAAGALELPAPLVRYRQHGSNVFGVRPPLSRLARLCRQVSGMARGYANLAGLGLDYAGLLDRLAAGRRDAIGTSYAAAAGHFRWLHEVYATRAGLYRDGVGFGGRAGAVARLVRSDAYRAVPAGGLGPQALAKDALLGLGGRMLLRG